MLALAVQTHGWESCRPLIEEKLLLGSRFRDQAEYYANLAMEFRCLNMHMAAVSIAKRIGTLICSMDGIISNLTAPAVVALLIMLFTISECHEELVPLVDKYLQYQSATKSLSPLVDKYLKEAPTVTMCRVVAKLRVAGSSDLVNAPMTKYFRQPGFT
ncbi:hypothetical protein L7F22_057577 [Adiantum nelumboides]|nr:hypothetical protein [Adiantum nelumboides]